MFFFFVNQKSYYEVRISYWSSDVCSSDLAGPPGLREIPSDDDPYREYPPPRPACRNAKQRSFARRCNDIWSHSATIYALRTAVGLRDRPEAAPPPPASMRWPKPCWSHRLEEWRHHSAPVARFAVPPNQQRKSVGEG